MAVWGLLGFCLLHNRQTEQARKDRKKTLPQLAIALKTFDCQLNSESSYLLMRGFCVLNEPFQDFPAYHTYHAGIEGAAIDTLR